MRQLALAEECGQRQRGIAIGPVVAAVFIAAWGYQTTFIVAGIRGASAPI